MPETQSSVKKFRKDVDKQLKKKPDPAAKAKVEQAEAELKNKNFDAAKALLEEAIAICQSSDVVAEKTEKKAKPAKEEAQPKADVAADAAAELEKDAKRLVLSAPSENTKDFPEEKKDATVFASPKRPNPKTGVSYAENTPEQLAKHLEATGGKIWTRFPPEPNGYLHLGHAKAMNFNFGQARLAGGCTYMRFDDTNPAAEKQEYIDSILKNVKWLGNEPFKITYSSDYFQELYQFAVQLIKNGKAFVCFQSKAEGQASRAVLRAAHIAAKGNLKELPEGAASPWRNASLEDNLKAFEDMRRGMYEEGVCCLRMKMDLLSPKAEMWDHAAYRVKYTPHPHSGTKWCIYPTYDYTHCIVDSLENITHSLCTLEFETRQASDGSYYWLLDALGLYKPVTWEYSRCNLTYNVMSKRKLNQLVTDGLVNGWDDPRLLTLDGMRRRGYTAGVINKFCEKIGVGRSQNTSRMQLLESVIREELNATAKRRFAVVDPLKVTITNCTGSTNISASNHPQLPEMGERDVPLSAAIYIEKADFKEVDEKGYFGLAPGKEVHLLHGPYITCVEVCKDSKGNITELKCEQNMEAPEQREPKQPKVKGHLHWVSVEHAVEATLNLYDYLFKTEDPDPKKPTDAEAVPELEGEEAEETGGGWLENINPESLVVTKGYVEPSLLEDAMKHGESYQFQRVGFFVVDLDSAPNKLVFNRVVGLKESSDKRAMGA